MNTKVITIIGAAIAISILAIVGTSIDFEDSNSSYTKSEKLGLVVNTPTSEITLKELSEIYETASETGIGRSNVYMFWNNIEPTRNTFDWKQHDVLMSLNKQNDLKVTLYFSLINGRSLGPFPSWIGNPSLASVSEDSVVNVLDVVLSRYDIIDSVIIAGDTDAHFRYHERDIPVYEELFNGVYDRIKENHPDVKIGNSFSLNGVLNKNLKHIVEELSDGDFVAFTYMPVDLVNEIVKTPDEAKADLEEIFELVPYKKVAIFETSWGTSDFVEGSEEDQRQFIKKLYDFYSENEQNLEFVTWYRLYDRPSGTCVIDPESTVSRGDFELLTSNEFVIERLGNYVCSAGLLDNQSNPKLGWSEFNNKIQSLKQ